MKLLLLLIGLWSFSMITGQRLVEVEKVEKLSISSYEGAFFPVLSDDGIWIAVRSYTKHGLRLYNLQTKQLKEICTSDYFCKHVLFSKDNKHIFYTVIAADGKEKTLQINSYNLESGITENLLRNQEKSSLWWLRSLSWWESKDEVYASAVSAGSLTYPLVTLKGGELHYYKNEDNHSVINPFDKRYYMFPSLSPDKTQIVAFAVGKGCFVYDIRDESARLIGDLEAPRWMKNELILGMNTHDDGHEVKTSSVIVLNVSTGEKQTILRADKRGVYPYYNKACDKLYVTHRWGRFI
ncbi:MAG: hypothetical protein N4A71_01440 [Carboxylicivirga sp.]|jgi:hypothetical protein|nr:hypothetical protein [Carboxylicivirga sp.]